MSLSSRAVAAYALARVIRHQSSVSAVLPPLLGKLPDFRDRGLAQELTYGSLRWYPKLNAIAKQLLRKPLKPRDQDIHSLILIGIYQLDFLDTPPHAAISATVEAARELDKGWAVKLLNGILRNYQRNQEKYARILDKDLSAKTAHPQWLLERLTKDWPKQLDHIIAANNSAPPMTVRVNLAQTTREDFLKALPEQELDGIASEHALSAVTLEKACDVHRLPGFDEGLCSIQDAAAQLVPALMDLQDNQRVLDACAAPGGKTGHILESAKVSIVALDVDQQRNERIFENLKRIKLKAEVLTGDAAKPNTWWDKKAFDRILLDAPCSGTGVIRRHPDIKSLRRPTDIPSLAEQQLELLNALWPTLAPGGLLLYVTCSILKQENTQVIDAFLKQQQDASEDKITADWGHKQPHGRQTLPGELGMDGFYFAVLRKQTE